MQNTPHIETSEEEESDQPGPIEPLASLTIDNTLNRSAPSAPVITKPDPRAFRRSHSYNHIYNDDELLAKSHYARSEPSRSRGGSATSDTRRFTSDIHALTHEAQELTALAEMKLQQRPNILGWMKKIVFKKSPKEGIFTAFLPKVQSMLAEVQQWDSDVNERKAHAIVQSEVLLERLRALVTSEQQKVDFFDDILNDYRRLLHSLNSVAGDIRNLVSLNEELVQLAKPNRPLSVALLSREQSAIDLSLLSSISDENHSHDTSPGASNGISHSGTMLPIESAPSTWTGYQHVDHLKVSPAGFKQALRNYVPKAIYSPPIAINTKKERPALSKAIPAMGRSTSAIMRELNNAEAAKDEERRVMPLMAEDADHWMLFQQLDTFKRLKQSILTKIEDMDSCRKIAALRTKQGE